MFSKIAVKLVINPVSEKRTVLEYGRKRNTPWNRLCDLGGAVSGGRSSIRWRHGIGWPSPPNKNIPFTERIGCKKW